MPTIAIHLDRTQNEKLAYNPETQQVPILALASKELNKAFAEENKSNVEVDFADPLSITSHHHRELSCVSLDVRLETSGRGSAHRWRSPPTFHETPVLISCSISIAILMHTISQALTESLGETISPTQIHDFELSLFDVQPATIGGALNEFIFSPRLDNLFSSYAAVSALAASVEKEDWGHDGRVAMIALWDNEEVGSVSAYGAESNFIESVLERVAVALKTEEESATEAYQRTLAKSFLLR